MSHGPNRYKSEKRDAEFAAKHGETRSPAVIRAQRVIAAWNVRALRRETADFFPTFAAALTAGYSRLTYLCPACQRLGQVDLRSFADAHHPRAPISAIIPKLSCQWCCPNPPLAVLIELASPAAPTPTIEDDTGKNRPSTHSHPAPPIPTMEDLPSHGVKYLNVWCGKWPYPCGHKGVVSVKNIDLAQTIVQFAAKLRCPQCGTIGGQAMPRWPNGGRGPGGAHNHARTAQSGKIEGTTAPKPRKHRSRKAR